MPGRSDVLIYPGKDAKSPEGCVVAGGSESRPNGPFTVKDSAVFKLRLHFYGTNTPNLVRDRLVYLVKEKNIKIEVRDIEKQLRLRRYFSVLQAIIGRRGCYLCRACSHAHSEKLPWTLTTPCLEQARR